MGLFAFFTYICIEYRPYNNIMKHLLSIIVAVLALLPATKLTARNHEEARAEVLAGSRGFYKDVFMDSGIALTSRRQLYAARFLGLSVEYFASASKDKLTKRDTTLQRNIFCGDENDTNGWLLYPDGAPRFRVIYVNGGSAAKHARSLGSNGTERIREYVANGGSYVGTCAGAFIASGGGIDNKNTVHYSDIYIKLWPGYAHRSMLRKSQPTLRLEKNSPLAKYFDFGKEQCIADVYHNGGCFAHTDPSRPLPYGTESLARYIFKNTDKVKIDNEISIWAYRANERSGRAILCGSHPERVGEGERLELMASMLLYAMESNPAPRIKGTLSQGVVREMNKRTEDFDPDHTRIGDRQYHHFAVDVPKKCKQLIIKLDGYEDAKLYDLTLCAKRGEPAFHDNTLLKSVASGCKKSLTIDSPKNGRWFVSVFCETTVEASTGKYGTSYRGRIAVLNGVPYKISVEYK